jgi:hypothetical protein
MAALAAHTDPASPLTARLLHLTDLHFWRVVLNPLRLMNKRLLGNANVALHRRHELRTHQAPAFLDYITGLGVRDVLLTGDFTSTSTDEEFALAKEFLQELGRRGITPRVFAGNHDVYTFESTRHRRFEKYLGDWLPAARLPAVVPLRDGFPVLYVPTVCPNLISSKGRITPGETEAVRDLLGQVSGPLLVSGHYPILDRTYGYATKPSRRLRNAAALGAALRAYKHPALYFCGHVHRFSHVQDPVAPNLTHLTSGALFRYDHSTGNSGDFSEIHAGPAGFRVVRHTFHGSWNHAEEPPRPASS